MPDKEKTIKGLELCLTPENSCEDGVVVCHEECPYFAAYNMGDCVRALAKDALALLKAQEPKPPVVKENSCGWKFYYCPSCGKEFFQNNKFSFCEKCGQAVKWK